MADFANLVLGVDTSGLKRGERDLKSFGAQSERTERKIDKFGGSAKRSFNTVALAATAALGAIVSVGSAVRVIAEFETSMSRLGAVSRATAGQLESLRDIAKDLGSTTEFSASQAANGLNFLAMAGFNATEAMAAIPSVLDLATASGLGLAEAADTASNIMSGFGIAAADAAEVADVLAAASTRANTTVGQLGAAMSTVAPIAAALDMSLEDTAAAIGVLSDAGIQGERAGTGLRGVLASLAGPTSQAETVLRGLGLTIADVDPATNELSVVMARLGAAGLSTADAMTLFGREAASGALVLIDGAQRVGDFGDELERADGAAGDMAKTMRDNLGGDLKGAASAAQGLAIALGDAGLTAAIRMVVQGITAMVRGFSAAVDFVGDFRGYFIATALTLTAVYTPAIIAATVATASWIASMIALRGALVATGIGALIVGAGLLINQFILLVEKVGSLGVSFGLLGGVAVGVWDKILVGGEILFLGLQISFSNINNSFVEMLGLMAQNWAKFSDSIAGTNLGELMGIEGGNSRSVELEYAAKLNDIAEAQFELTGALGKAKKRMGETTAGMDELRAAMAAANEDIDAGVEGAAALAAELEGVVGAIDGSGGASGAVTQLADDLDDAADATDQFTQTFKDGMTDAIDYTVGGFRDGFAGLLNIIKSTLLQAAQFAIANPIKLALGLGGTGAAGMASQAIGGSGILGSALGGLSALSGGIGSGVAVAMNGIMAGGGLGPAMGAISGGLGMGGAAGIGTAIGAVAVPLLAVAAAFSFFRKKTTELDAGMRISVDGMESLVEGFKKIQTSRFFGLSKKVADEFEAMDAATATPLQNAVNGVLLNVFDMATGLGVAASTFDDFTTSLIVSTKGLDDAQAQVAIQDALRDIGVEFAEMATDLFEFQRHGENAAMILQRLNTSVAVANGTLETLGLRIFDLTLGGANAASVFLDAFVSLEAFNNASILYYDKFFSNAEKMASATALMTDAFAEMGFELPRTRDQFRQLLEAQDMTTESGRQAVAVLLQVSGAFDELTTQLDNLNANLASALNGFASGISAQKSVIVKAVDALVKPLEDAINRTRVEAENSYQIFKVAADKTADSAKNIVDIIRGTLDSRTIQSEVVELQRYQRAQRQLASFAGGSSFDETSLTRATEGVSINSQKFFGSFEDYARDFYKTQISLTSLAEKAEGELSDVETQIAIAEKAYQIAQGTYQEAQDFNVALDNLLLDLASFTETSARNQPFIDQIKAEGERQILLLDAILVETTKQVNGFLGIENSVADLAGSNVSVAEALGILGIEENEMSGAVIALKTPVAEIGSHIAALDLTLGGAYDRLGLSIGDLANLDLASGFVDLDLAAPFEGLNLTGDLETKVSLLGGNVVAFSSALTLATGGLGINVTNLGTTIDASMVSLGSFLNSLTASINALSIARAAIPTPVIDLYTNVLGRTSDELGLAYWRSTGLTGQALEDAFRQGAVNSGEVGSLEDLPQFANGGMHSGGPRIVGEQGAELEVTGPSRIYNNADTKKMFSGGSEELIQELRNLRQEVTNLRNQNRDIGVQAVKYGKKLYDLNREWDIVGLPPIRTA